MLRAGPRSIVLGLGAVFGGFWALYNYHRTRRYEAARWLQGVFKDFYLSGRFKEVRELLEYDYPERAGPLLERRIADRHVPITPEEREVLGELDNLLNYAGRRGPLGGDDRPRGRLRLAP